MLRLFSKIYDKVMRWSTHPNAQYYLIGLSFSEASFFPIPPDVMLAPMSLSKPERAWWYAMVTTLSSTLGGLFGYGIGVFFLALIKPWIVTMGYMPAYTQAQLWFHHYGFVALIVAGFTPIPYKLFTIAAGGMSMSLGPFVLGAFLGRGARFYLVAALMKLGGAKMEKMLRSYIDIIGWATLVIVALLVYIYH